MKRFVLDTSVIVKWLAPLDEEDKDKAELLLQDFKAEKVEIITSEFVYYEIANALYWSKKLEEDDYNFAVNTLKSLPFLVHTFKENTALLAYQLMKKLNISYYDAEPLALAKFENCSLISADEKHHGKLKETILFKDY